MKIEESDLRKKIEKLYNECNFDSIGELPDFLIIERRDFLKDRKARYACVGWAFQGDEKAAKEYADRLLNGKIPQGFLEVESPIKGDFVNYFSRHRPKNHPLPYHPRHTGLYVGNGRVQSKFAEGHVFEHQLSAVPLWYGNEVNFLRKVPFWLCGNEIMPIATIR